VAEKVQNSENDCFAHGWCRLNYLFPICAWVAELADAPDLKIYTTVFFLRGSSKPYCESLAGCGFERSRAPTHYSWLQLIFRALWKKKWQKNAK
jgi:hypothetical protein